MTTNCCDSELVSDISTTSGKRIQSSFHRRVCCRPPKLMSVYERVDTFFSYDQESRCATSRANSREMRGKKQTPVFPRATHHDIEIKHEFEE